MSQVSERDFVFTWKIENFSFCPLPDNERLESQIILVDSWKKRRLQLWFYPRGWKGSKYLSCYVKIFDAEKWRNVSIESCFTIKGSDVCRIKTEKRKIIPAEKVIYGEKELTLRYEIFQRKNIFLPNDTLTLQYHIWISDQEKKTTAADFCFGNQNVLTDQILVSAARHEVEGLRKQLNPSQCSAVTRIRIGKKSLVWPIKGIRGLEPNNRISIPVFSALNDDPSFVLTFYFADGKKDGKVEVNEDRQEVDDEDRPDEGDEDRPEEGDEDRPEEGDEDKPEEGDEDRPEEGDEDWTEVGKKERQEEGNEDPIAYFEIHRMESDLSEHLFVECNISALNSASDIKFLKKESHLFQRKARGEIWKVASEIHKSEIEKWYDSINDVLYLRCEFTYSREGNGFHSESEDAVPLLCKIPADTKGIDNQLKDLYDTGILSDVALRVENRTFKAHKNILSTRSPVFRAMFENNMTENRTGLVDVTDVDPDSMDRLLIFLYSNKFSIPGLNEAIKLYTAADKYQVLALKCRCLLFIQSELSVSSVSSILSLANFHQDDKLMKAAMEFVHANRNEVFASENWKALMETDVKLCASVMFQMLTGENN